MTLLVLGGQIGWAWPFHEAGWRVVWAAEPRGITIRWLSRYVGIVDAVGGWQVDPTSIPFIRRISEVTDARWWVAVTEQPAAGETAAWTWETLTGYGNAQPPVLQGVHDTAELAFFAANSRGLPGG